MCPPLLAVTVKGLVFTACPSLVVLAWTEPPGSREQSWARTPQTHAVFTQNLAVRMNKCFSR